MLLLVLGFLLALPGLVYFFLVWNFDHWRKRGVKDPKALSLVGNYPSAFSRKQHPHWIWMRCIGRDGNITRANYLGFKSLTILGLIKKTKTAFRWHFSQMKIGFHLRHEEFRSERFLENGGVKKYRDIGAYFGFGDGPRACPGTRFAVANMKGSLVKILRNFDVTVNPRTRTDYKLDPTYFMARLDGGVWLDFYQRQ